MQATDGGVVDLGLFAGIADALVEKGWSEVKDFLPSHQVAALAAEAVSRRQAGGFRPARVGMGDGRQLRPEVRCDEIAWLDPREPSPAQQPYFLALESLRQAINATTFLGLFEFEGHLACYPPGSFYKKHLDQFAGVEARTVTCVLYLNDAWKQSDGGMLRLYLDDPLGAVDVLPRGGTLMCFLSGCFFHEVLPASRERLSLTGWFKTRTE